MSYLASRMILCLLGALAIGLIVGWLLRRFSAIEREAELSGEIDLRDERLGTLEGEVGERDMKIQSLGRDLGGLRNRVPALESTLAQRDDQVMTLTMDLDGWKEKVPGLESRLAESTAAREQLSADLETAREEVSANKVKAAEEIAGYTSELSTQKQTLDGLRLELSDATAATAEAVEKRTALQGEFDSLKKHSDAQTAEGREREQALNEARTNLKSQDAERASLAEQLTALAPVASRVDSQDASIVSLNNDLRARDTTIKGLRDELAASSDQNKKLQVSARSLEVLRVEMDGMREELLGTQQKLSAASSSDNDAAAKAKGMAADSDREWRSRLRIAESGRQQAQADLYRRQEQIDRLQKQLNDARATDNSRGAAGSAGAFAPQKASFAGSLARRGPAGKVAATDDRDWRARLRVVESARRKAETQVQREHEHVERLEARLRAAQSRPAPGQATAFATNNEKAAKKAKATPKKAATSPAVSKTAAPKAASAVDLSEQRFLTAPPSQVDDLRAIKGVGKVLQKTLNSLGIYQYRQVADFTAKDIAWVDDRLKFKGRIERDKWVAQAAKLHKAKYK